MHGANHRASYITTSRIRAHRARTTLQDSLGVQARKLSVDGKPLPWLVGLRPCDSAPRVSYSRSTGMDPEGHGQPKAHDNREWTVRAVAVAARSGGDARSDGHARGDGSAYQIVNGATGRCLSTDGAGSRGSSLYSPVVLLPCGSGSGSGSGGVSRAQQWTFGKGLHSPTSVVNAATGTALAVSNSTLYSAVHGSDAFAVSDLAYGYSGLTMVAPFDQPNCTGRSCQNYDPSQMWYYSPSEQLLRHSTYVASINHKADGIGYRLTEKVPTSQHFCLGHVLSTHNSGSASGTTEVWGGPLRDGAFVVGVLNRGTASATVAVDWSMFEGAMDPDAKYAVRDLWAQAPAAGVRAAGFEATVPAHDIALYKLTPQ
jgi:hypothetical protein